MDFTMVIPASEFKDFQLKVVSLAPIKVSVIGHDDEVLEQFQTSSSYSMYGFKTKNEAIKDTHVESELGFRSCSAGATRLRGCKEAVNNLYHGRSTVRPGRKNMLDGE